MYDRLQISARSSFGFVFLFGASVVTCFFPFRRTVRHHEYNAFIIRMPGLHIGIQRELKARQLPSVAFVKDVLVAQLMETVTKEMRRQRLQLARSPRGPSPRVPRTGLSPAHRNTRSSPKASEPPNEHREYDALQSVRSRADSFSSTNDDERIDGGDEDCSRDGYAQRHDVAGKRSNDIFDEGGDRPKVEWGPSSSRECLLGPAWVTRSRSTRPAGRAHGDIGQRRGRLRRPNPTATIGKHSPSAVIGPAPPRNQSAPARSRWKPTKQWR